LGVEVVEEKYKIKLTKWDVYYPVSGINFKNGTKWNFGRVTFVKNSNRAFKKAINTSPMCSLNDLNVSCFAYIEVIAADSQSAIRISEPVLDFHIATLNALSNISGSYRVDSTFSSYMPLGESIHSLIFVGQKGYTLGWSRCMSLHLAGFNPHLLRGSQFIKGFSTRLIGKQLKTGTSDLFEKRLLLSLKWVGKATFQKTNEEKFLYYCLAFEALLYEQKFEKDVMATLKKRTYKLLFTKGRYLGSSINSHNKFDYIYDIRSAIVHRGGIEVTDSDIFLIRDLVIGCLFKFYHDKSLSRIKTSNQLEKWLTK